MLDGVAPSTGRNDVTKNSEPTFGNGHKVVTSELSNEATVDTAVSECFEGSNPLRVS